MNDHDTCPLCACEVDCCLCAPKANVELARTARLTTSELESLHASDERLEILERGRGGSK